MPESNPRRESVAVMIGAPFAGDAERAFEHTRAALGVLRDVRVAAQQSITTKSGLPGMRFDLTFRPDAADEVYTRSHVVLFVEGAQPRTVHFLYTAAGSGRESDLFARVVASVARGS